MTREIFDYSKCSRSDYTSYGFHLKNGRYHIDTKRIKKLHCDGSFPDEFFSMPRNTHYLIAKYIYKNDWAFNFLRNTINKLSSDWNNEFKDAIEKLVTPKEVEEKTRLNEIAYTSCVEDYEEIEFHSLMAGIKREKKYKEVIKSIHLQYIQVYCSTDVSKIIDGKEHGFDIKNYSSGQQEIVLKLKDFQNTSVGTDLVLLDEPETYSMIMNSI